MVSPIRDRAVLDINATVDLHRDIIPDLLAAHGLTSCDTVATYFGIGKAASLIVLTSDVHALTFVGDTSRILSEVTAQATPFILACYGQYKCTAIDPTAFGWSLAEGSKTLIPTTLPSDTPY